MSVKPKKHLGQHFLTDLSVAERIANALEPQGQSNCLEIGPGTGVLTQFLLQRDDLKLLAFDVDEDSIEYLKVHYVSRSSAFVLQDFLKSDLNLLFDGEPFRVIGNFPYNISSQILFKILDYKNQVPEMVGMFQKEVAERAAAGPGSKIYGIVSVLLQAYYDVEYLFTVSEDVFNPPPKVKSGVIRMKRLENDSIPCDEGLFKQVVKMSFNQRRKTIRNSIKGLIAGREFGHPLLTQRPEQLSVEQFFDLTQSIEKLSS